MDSGNEKDEKSMTEVIPAMSNLQTSKQDEVQWQTEKLHGDTKTEDVPANCVRRNMNGKVGSKKHDKQWLLFSRTLSSIKNIRDDTIPCRIEKGLFLGSYDAAQNKVGLKSLNITHVLTVAAEISPPHPDDFTCKKVEVQDLVGTILTKYFDECFQFIDEATTTGGGILVHCVAGRSRSATIIIAYLMKKRGMTLHQAIQHVKSVRRVIAPNLGFMRQLADYEQALEEQDPSSHQQKLWRRFKFEVVNFVSRLTGDMR